MKSNGFKLNQIIIKINDNNELVYDASTKSGSSGSPILLKDTKKIIGIHKKGNTKTGKKFMEN